MKYYILLFSLFVTVTNLQAQTTELIDFEKATAEGLPGTWAAASGTWKITRSSVGQEMQQAGSTPRGFNICTYSKVNAKNVEIEVRIKALTGMTDQGGGLIWRYQDKENYYLARANPLENNFRLYTVVNGSRSQLQSVNITMNTGEWFVIKILTVDDKIECYYNSKKIISRTDGTFKEAGLIGLWTKADAVSVFDDLRIRELK